MRARGLGIFVRIAAGYALVLLVLLVMSGILYARITHLAGQTEEIANQDQPAFRSVADLSTQVYAAEQSANRFLTESPEPGRSKWLNPYYTARAAMDLDLTRLEEWAAEPTHGDIRPTLHDLEARLQARWATLDNDIAAAGAGQPLVELTDRSVAIANIESAAERFRSVLGGHVKGDAVEAAAVAQQTLTLIIGLLVIAILITLVAGFLIARSIASPLAGLTTAANRIAAGEMIDPPALQRRDEIGVLSTAVTRMVRSLRGLAEKERGLRVDLAEHQRVQGELQRSNAELEQFAYVASHDLQEPLRMVGSYTGLIKRRYQGKLDSEADEFIAYAMGGVTRMQALINDLLTYSRAGRGDRPLEEIDAGQALARALDSLQTAIAEKKAVVSQGAMPLVVANPIQLTQLFQNLVGNALKFCKDGRPEIRVGAERQGSEWVFSVQDNGIGIDPQYRDRIFLIFQRLHKREEFEGTGIGLAICKKIVEQQGGRIWVESEPGHGSTFKFTLPAIGAQQLAA
jgi:signal transduction histidine kinase